MKLSGSRRHQLATTTQNTDINAHRTLQRTTNVYIDTASPTAQTFIPQT